MATSDEQRTCNVVQLGDGSAEAWLREHDKQHENGRVHLGCCQAANILRVLFQHAPQVRADERHLRRLLCAHVAGSRAYMDDGEASDCSEQPHIDFLRDSPSQIEQALYDRAIKRAALAANPQQINESGGPSLKDCPHLFGTISVDGKWIRGCCYCRRPEYPQQIASETKEHENG